MKLSALIKHLERHVAMYYAKAVIIPFTSTLKTKSKQLWEGIPNWITYFVKRFVSSWKFPQCPDRFAGKRFLEKRYSTLLQNP